MTDSTLDAKTYREACAAGESTRSLVLQGIRDCDRGRYSEALEALDIAAHRLGGLGALPPRALSAYGVAIASDDGARRTEGLAYCRLAIRRKPTDPILYRMLATVYVLEDAKHYAVHTLDAGLKVGPRDTGLNIARTAIGMRSPPVFKSLHRSHPANKYLGMLRHRIRRLLS